MTEFIRLEVVPAFLRLIEDLYPIHLAFPQFLLFSFRHIIYRLALKTAAAVKLFCAGFTLNEQEVTTVVFTIGMIVAGRTALVAVANHVLCDPLPQAFIEYKVLAFEFIGNTFLAYLVSVFNDTAFKVVYIFKTVMQ